MLTLIVNGEVYSPAPLGAIDVLIAGDKIEKLGQVDRAAVETIGVEVEIIDASGCVVTPGFIDPHEQPHGGSGEQDFSTQTPRFESTKSLQPASLRSPAVSVSTPLLRRWRDCSPARRR